MIIICEFIFRRRCEAVTCVDCSVTFYGDDFEAHVTCVSEAEKYEKSLHVPKKVKTNPQDLWIAIIEKAVENLKSAPIELQPHLQRIQEFSNIPRNKNKFTNFCKNSLRLFQEPAIAKLWTHLDTFKAQEKGTENSDTVVLPGAVIVEEVGASQGKKDKSKKKAVTEEAIVVEGDDPASSIVKVKKDKKKKRKEIEEGAQQQEEEERGDPAAASEETEMDKKKRKKDKKLKKPEGEE